MGSSAFYSRFGFIYIPSLNLVLNYKLVCHIKSSTDSTSQIIQRVGDGAKMQRTQPEIFCTLSLSPRRFEQARKINLCVRVAWFTFAQWKSESSFVFYGFRGLSAARWESTHSVGFWGCWLDLSQIFKLLTTLHDVPGSQEFSYAHMLLERKLKTMV